MIERVDVILDRLFHRRPGLAKLVRYSAASMSGTVTTQLALVVTFTLLGMSPAWANIVSVTAGAVPNYLINRAWTFNKRDAHSFHREVLPFWGLTLAGLALSTVTVAWAANRYDDSYLVVSGANIGSFGALWVGKYFVLEHVLFRHRHPERVLVDESA